MRKESTLRYLLAGLFVLAMLTITLPIASVTANEPVENFNFTLQLPMRCRLEIGIGCDLSESITDIGLSQQTFPPDGARGIQPYKPISVTFDKDIDPGSINSKTFYVTQGAKRIKGSVDYISLSRMAIFHPDTPLELNTTYTARVTRRVRDLSAQPLIQDIIWTFTTAVEQSPLTQGIPLALSPDSGQSSAETMHVYFGDLHSQSGHSDGQGTPADAFASAKASGIDFFALTDHGFLLDDGEWRDILNQANAATVEGEFVALRGFEYTHEKGHLNVFNTNTYVSRDNPRYDTLEEFYTWLIAQPTAIGQFNHPFPNFNFDDFAPHNTALDEKIPLREITTPSQFFHSLNMGWRVSSLKNSDTHIANWGCCPTMGLIAPELTQEAIIEAMRAGRTFLLSPQDRNLAVVLQANGHWMGSTVQSTSSFNFTVTAYDPDPTGGNLNLLLYENGVPIATVSLQSNLVYTWSGSIPAKPGHYYFVAAYYDGWSAPPAYSSPIWIE